MAIFSDQSLQIIIKAKDRASKVIRDVEKSLIRHEKAIKKMQPAFRKMALVGTASFAAVALGANKAISKARDFEEETNKFNVVFKDVSIEAQKMADTLNESYGLSILQSKQLLSATGDILTGFGFTGEAALDLSSRVNTLSVDIASFTNAQGGAEAVSSALTKALLGERESLKTYGIAIMEADVQAELLAQGMDKLTGEALRQAKAQVTLDLIFRQSKNSVGDYARSTGTLTQTQKELNKEIEDAQIAIGETLAPVMNDILKKIVPVVAKLADWVKENPKLTKTIILATGALAALVATIGAIGLVLPAVITGFLFLKSGLVKTTLAFRNMTTVMKANVIFAVLSVAIMLIINRFQKFADEVGTFGRAWKLWMLSIQNTFWSMVQSVLEGVNKLTRFIPGIGSAIEGALDKANAKVKETEEKFNALVVEGLAPILSTSKKIGETVPEAFKAVASAAVEASEEVKKANEEIANTQKKVADLQKSFMKDLISEKTNLARAFVDQENKIAKLQVELEEKKASLIRNISDKAGFQQRKDQENEIASLQASLNTQKNALESARTIEKQLNAEVVEERRRDALTDFERELEDIRNKIVARTNEFGEKMKLLKLELEEKEKQAEKLRVVEKSVTATVKEEVEQREAIVVASIDKQIAKYGQLASAASRASSFSSGFRTGGVTTPAFISREHGGRVPGPQGLPVPIIAHGQEQVIPANQTRGGSSLTVVIQNPQFRNGEDEQRMKRMLDTYFRPLLINHKITA